MDNKERTRLICSKTGNRKYRFEFNELGITGKISIKIIFKDIDPNLDKKELTKKVDDYVNSTRDIVRKDLLNFLSGKFADTNSLINSNTELSKFKDDFYWKFKLTLFDDSFDTENYKCILTNKFNALKRVINQKAKDLEGKKVIMDWVDKNPYLSTFPLARTTKRKFIFHMGPTNSGKTYQAIQDLKSCNSGCYLAPLRLLAHEVYDELNQSGTYCSMITGEERILVPGATVVSSTVEMANFNTKYDVAVIDEIQMLTDDFRGWAWNQAVCGIAADKIYLAGSEEALPYVKYLIEEILDDELEVVEFDRKTNLIVENKVFDLEKDSPQDGDAFIVFSRKNVFELKSNLIGKASMIYGSLSPEVRKSEAKKFKDGDTKYVIATDAIGMGLNLPIKRVIFVDTEKFDGISKSRPVEQIVKQIAGRAGRYGLYEEGYVTSVDKGFKKYIQQSLDKKYPSVITNYKYQISPNLDLIKEISDNIDTKNLVNILYELREIFFLDQNFKLMNIDNMISIAEIVHNNLKLEDKFIYSCAPISMKLRQDKETFTKWSVKHHNNKKITIADFPSMYNIKNKPTSDRLWFMENRVKLLSCYIWMSFRYPEIYSDVEVVTSDIQKLNEDIIKLLDKKTG